MLHDDEGRCLFSEPGYIEGLPYGGQPYWYVLEKCRHIGVHKVRPGLVNWHARVLTKGKKYKQKKLGRALDAGDKNLSYDEALALARQWFASPDVQAIASASAPIGTMKYLMVCPIGDVYTVGHALKDYIEWRKIAATPKGYYNTLCLINYHLVPQISHIPLDEFGGKNLRDLAKTVLETPPKKGTQIPHPPVRLADLDADQIRRRKVTLNTLIGILRMSFKMAWENGHTDSERAWRCLRRVPVIHKPRAIFLSRPECRALLAECKPPLRRLVLGALYSGCRVGELSSLRVQDVGRDGYGIYVEAGLPPLEWSSAMFRRTEEIHGKQAPQARRDCHEATAG